METVKYNETFFLITLILLPLSSMEASSCDDYGNFQPYRTSFHFQAHKNWLNDPNGPLYYKGFYHLFYQHNPLAPYFGDIMVWGHSVSQDLVNWIQLEPAIYPSDPSDINSCWSGSATILPDGKPVMLYTGSDTNKHQVTVLAEPKDASDPLLREWVKAKGNPVMVPPSNVPVDGFRDPTTAWQGQDGRWRVIVGAEEKDSEKGMAILYHSDDFYQWIKYPVPLLESQITGMWECPDFFPVSVTGREGVDTSVNNSSVRHVLKASYGGSDCYVIGSYSSETEIFSADSEFTNTADDLKYDYGTLYASKAFFDSAKNRRISWGWIMEKDSSEDDIVKGWAGIMGLPREIWLGRSGKKLMQWPVEEINNLRARNVSLYNKKLESGSVLEISGITASQADIEVAFDLRGLENDPEISDLEEVDQAALLAGYSASVRGIYGPFGLLALASNDLAEHTAIFFRVIRRGNGYSVVMSSDESKSSLRDNIEKATYGTVLDIDPRHEKISLRCLIDHSVIESFGGEGRSVITSRVYPKIAIGEESRLYVFNHGTKGVTISSLEAWSMRKAQINSNAT
ncbi:PREDICTED: beta-fructofuranosidase, insoluble isoenzyme CWINV6-like [Camelina sativa]|uniref:Beta-fructofuranosidase, insoluble isoenzyme CWINV6-like n=1 Tax=Camelina sativa TaxID=90675 RepID=A0ABM0XWB8_CAMSA|nr:PREDICTED: beta-fructofuranosidase, insoluble isoenzyme CWINV6-like [Camelina sativa]XP_010491946.1 PREDICTED: beta-fructofuranosidase, insoluble isoenzyme CWINV6-like [Camelina sativa]